METPIQPAAQQQNLSTSKVHFASLDGLRGIAAISVVLFHFMEIAAPDYKDNFVAHSYLAVDFFFCLSGFVIAYSYDDKLGKMGLKTFFKRRLIRLHPLVVIGAIIGFLAFVFDPFSNLKDSFSTTQIVLMLLSACFMIPYAIVPQRYNNLFHYNPPTWSLFWEYVANIVYAFFLVRAKKPVLWILFVVSAALLFWEADRSKYLGFGFGGDNFWSGGIRLFFAFTAGVLIYRLNIRLKRTFPFWLLAIMLAAVFFIPFSWETSPIIDPLIVVFYFPVLIILGTGQKAMDAKTKGVCNWLGELSYPLYMVHYPFIWLFLSYVEQYKPNGTQMSYIIVIGMLLLILFSYLVAEYIDKPIRKMLSKNL